MRDRLTDDEDLLLGELVRGNLEVQRSGTLADTAGDIVVRTVARAEPAAVVTGLADGHTTQVGADTQHDQPLGLLNTLVVGLGVAQALPLCVTGLVDLILGTVTDEDGLSTPLDDDLFGNVLGYFEGGTRASSRTFLPSGMAPRAISTLAWARTSAEADMLTRKSVGEIARSVSVILVACYNCRDPSNSTGYPPISSQKDRGIKNRERTLDSSLGTDGGSQTHGAGHEVGEDLVGPGGLVGLVFAEVGDLQGRATLVGSGEGALEGGLSIGDSPRLLAGGDGGAGGRQLLAGASAQQSAGSGGERHGEAIDHTDGVVDRNCVGRQGVREGGG